jgi:hypothetical protein
MTFNVQRSRLAASHTGREQNFKSARKQLEIIRHVRAKALFGDLLRWSCLGGYGGRGACSSVHGILGESVSAQNVAVSMERLEEATRWSSPDHRSPVWSGFRFVKPAAVRRIPIGIVNIGTTRGDELARATCSRLFSACRASVTVCAAPWRT